MDRPAPATVPRDARCSKKGWERFGADVEGVFFFKYFFLVERYEHLSKKPRFFFLGGVYVMYKWIFFWGGISQSILEFCEDQKTVGYLVI